MRFALSQEQKKFFFRNGFLELEGLIKEEDCQKLLSFSESLLQKRLDISAERFERVSPENLVLAGRDLWRDSEELFKIISHKTLGKIAADLIEERSLRLLYDQALFTGTQNSIRSAKDKAFEPLFTGKKFSLKELSGFQGKICGFLICLSPSEEETELAEENGIDSSEMEALFQAPKKAGDIVLLKEDHPFPFNFFLRAAFQRYLLVVYSEEKVVYVQKETDPLNHHLKKYGMVFGDKLKENLHPMVLRK